MVGIPGAEIKGKLGMELQLEPGTIVGGVEAERGAQVEPGQYDIIWALF